MASTLVIVESPAKAKTISAFLGKDYEVIASYGHIRDLPENKKDIPEEYRKKKWADLGVNIEKDFEPFYVVPSEKKRRVEDLKKAAKGASRLLLATDEDREGESISWHVLQLLKPKKGTEIARIVFHEITPEAIQHALSNPRQIDEELVRAQETRRILDRLYGYTLSPMLWRRVARGLSAGRVQSVAVRLVVMRERERRDFVSASYSRIDARLKATKGELSMRLVKIGQKNLADGQSFSAQGELTEKNAFWLKKDEAQSLEAKLSQAEPWKVSLVDRKPGQENPPPPFMTSTLQQEANRKLGFPARKTMQVAQQLYEGVDMGGERIGLITYMRTDSLTLSERALEQAQAVISDLYGKEFLAKKPKQYKSKAKNAQEAHEAIRPTDLGKRPADVEKYLDKDQIRLYELIWKRTLACQMAPAEVERTKLNVEVIESSETYTFSTSGKSIVFPGFLKVYVEGSDDPESDLSDKETILPETKVGEVLNLLNCQASHLETKPPARYTEASLVQKLEAEGVGRPSTYASIIGTIQDRGYVFKRKNELIPTWTAFSVIEILEDNFERLVDLGFTADMESELDEIADGKRDWVNHLKTFYLGSEGRMGLADEVSSKLPTIPFPMLKLYENVVVRIGRNGPFIQRGEGGPGQTASVPDDIPPADLTPELVEGLLSSKSGNSASVGTDPETGKNVVLKKGRFGAYLEIEDENAETPKRATLPPGLSSENLNQEIVEQLLQFPKNLGIDPSSNEPVIVAIGRYGAYLTAGERKANIGEWKNAVNLGLQDALQALETGRTGRTMAKPEPIREFGALKVLSGRYGPYVTDGKLNATIPKSIDPATITEDQAADLIKAKAAAGPSKRPFRRARKSK